MFQYSLDACKKIKNLKNLELRKKCQQSCETTGISILQKFQEFQFCKMPKNSER